MAKIKIVTAYFDIGRDQYEIIPRTNDQYLEYFRFWARIKNDLVVYCDPRNKNEILKIRSDFGLSDKTEIITIDNIYDIEPDIFKRMCKVEESEDFQNFRYRYHDPSNFAKYDYVMLLKSWFMADAASRTPDDVLIAWIDLGFNHGGRRYDDSNDFNFLWDYDFPNKINIFCRSTPDNICLIDCLQFQTDCLIGGSIIIPVNLCEFFWLEIKKSMDILLNIGCIDDDQMLMLMAYNRNKNLFSVVKCDWFDVFLKCSDKTFSIAQPKKQQENKIQGQNKRAPIIIRLYDKLLWCYRRIRYEDYPQKELHPFLLRMQKKKEKYYR